MLTLLTVRATKLKISKTIIPKKWETKLEERADRKALLERKKAAKDAKEAKKQVLSFLICS